MTVRLSETPRWARGMSEAQVEATLDMVGSPSVDRAWKWDGGMSPVEPEGRNISTFEASRFCVQPSTFPWTKEKQGHCNSMLLPKRKPLRQSLRPQIEPGPAELLFLLSQKKRHPQTTAGPSLAPGRTTAIARSGRFY